MRTVSGGVVFIEVFSLELQNVPDQQLSILIGHPDEAAMEAVRVVWVEDRVNTQHFEVGLKEHLVGKEQAARKNVAGREGCINHHADAATAQVDGFLGELPFGVVRLRLETNGQRDIDAVVFSAVLPIRRRSRGI
ncbi:MAG: hypothetical protein LV473_18700 [Nitrospira sp.]|nr:hypothetical protein [Nitrospira sp.]